MSVDFSVLVTGGAGYVGSHVVLALVDAGHDVVVLDDFSAGFPDAVATEARLVEGDIGDRDLVGGLIEEHRIGAVIHMAASVVVSESVAKPLAYYQNNTVKSRDLVASCLERGVHRFIFSSTAAVYGDPESQPITEDAPTLPINPYGRSKLMTEWMLADTAVSSALRYIALRYFNVAGADPEGRIGQRTPQATHLIKAASEVAVGIRGHIDVYGDDYPTPDGTCVRDYIHVSDIAAAHVAALAHLGGGGENLTLNCGYGRGYSVREVLDAVVRVTGQDLDIRSAPRRAGDPAELVAAVSRISEALGWRPVHDDLDGIVRSAIEWEKKIAVAG